MTNTITKETVLDQLQNTSNGIASKFDNLYWEDLKDIAEELAVCYSILFNIINREDQSSVSDSDFQSALMYWTALNTVMGAIELFRRGYSKEPQALIRNAVEIFSAAYDIHINPDKLEVLQKTPKKFDSTDSISEAKKAHMIIGQMYGVLSESYTHVSLMHTVPHKSKSALCIGGLFDPEEQKYSFMIIPIISLATDVLSSLLELTFIKEVSDLRHWEKISEDSYNFKPIEEIRNRAFKMMAKMRDVLSESES